MQSRTLSQGVVARRRLGTGLVGAAALAGFAGFAAAHPARADEAGESAAQPVAEVVVEARRKPMDRDTGLATLPTSLQDTPQAVTVIGEKQLKEQGVTTLEQALRNVPGITIAIGEGGTLNGDQFKIRGFDAKDDVYVDGLRDFGVYTRDSFPYQEVQVLKGPSGAMFGRGTVGGAINTVGKAPKPADFSNIDTYVGNGDYYRALGDFNRRIGPNAAARLNLMASSTGVVDRDQIGSKRWGASLTAGWGLGTDTSFTVNYLHQRDDRTPDYGVIIVQKPGDLLARPATEYDVGIGRSHYLGFDTDHDRSFADVLTARFSRKATPWLTLTSDSRLGTYSRRFQYTTVDQCNAACTTALFDGNPATIPFGGIGGGGPYKQRAWGAQNISTARADWSLGGLRNQTIVGVDLSFQSNKKTFFAYTLPAGITARNLIPRDLIHGSLTPPAGYTVFLPTASNITCPTSGNCTTDVLGTTVFASANATTALYTDGEASDLGVFVTDRLWFTDQLSLIGSYRYDRYDADFDTTTVSFVKTQAASTSNLRSPRVSLVFEPSGNQTYYLSWGRSATPQGTSIVGAGTAIALTARDLAPEISESREAGAKIALFDGRLGLNGSIFDIKKDNATQTDPSTGSVVAQSGQKQEVKGFELGATGKLSEVWTVNAGYTRLNAKIVEDFSCRTTAPIVCKPNPFTIGRPVTFVPKNSASLWTSYDLKKLVPGLTVGGGVTWQSKLWLGYTIAGTAPNPTGLSKIAVAPENLTFDAYATWRVNDHVRVAFNGYNLSDRLNYTQVFSNRAVPAPGRTFILSLGTSF
jgi:catecholate siderophore receptor